MSHALISPSSLKRTILCPGSVQRSSGCPNTDSAASLEGTTAHALFEAFLTGKRKRAPKGTDPEMASLIRECADWVKELAHDEEATIICEELLPVGEALGLPDPTVCWGTADVVLVSDHSLRVIDLKYGRIDVDAMDNAQLLAYLKGAIHKYGERPEMEVIILQPRSHTGGSEWSPTEGDVERFTEEALAAIEAALAPMPPVVPGEEQCQWCPAAGSCRAHIDWALAPFKVEEPADLSPQEMSELLTRGKVLIKTLEAVQAKAIALISAGIPVPGWKVVESITHTRWIADGTGGILDELARAGLPVEKLLAPPTLLSPAKASQAVKSPLLEQFFFRPRGAPTLAPEKDRRPSIAPTFTAE